MSRVKGVCKLSRTGKRAEKFSIEVQCQDLVPVQLAVDGIGKVLRTEAVWDKEEGTSMLFVRTCSSKDELMVVVKKAATGVWFAVRSKSERT